MLKEERQSLILEILNSEQRVIASDLKLRLDVSEDTIRRDLKELDTKKLLKRVHSGALRIGPPVQHFETRREQNNALKFNLSNLALPFLVENTVILIDGGTTNLSLVNLIPLNFACTIITNSPPVAVALSKHENIEIIMLGGTLYKESMVNLGIDTLESLSSMRVDLYVMGIYNIDHEEGISVPTLNEALIKRKMMAISTEILGMATSNKLGTVSHQIVSPAKEVTYLITEKISDKFRKQYTDLDISVFETD